MDVGRLRLFLGEGKSPPRDPLSTGTRGDGFGLSMTVDRTGTLIFRRCMFLPDARRAEKGHDRRLDLLTNPAGFGGA